MYFIYYIFTKYTMSNIYSHEENCITVKQLNIWYAKMYLQLNKQALEIISKKIHKSCLYGQYILLQDDKFIQYYYDQNIGAYDPPLQTSSKFCKKLQATNSFLQHFISVNSIDDR